MTLQILITFVTASVVLSFRFHNIHNIGRISFLNKTHLDNYPHGRSSTTIATSHEFQFRSNLILSSQSSEEDIILKGKSPTPLKAIIAGAPAAGKGTQCEAITERFNVVHLSTGDILRAAVSGGTAVGMKAKSYMDAGKLVPDEVIIDVVCERLKQNDCITRGWLLDGFPRTKSQADALIAAGMIPDCFILLNVPEEVLVERVTGRRTDPVTGKIYHMKFSPPENAEVAARLVQRSDDTAEKIVVRYKEFQSHIDSVKSSFEDKMILVDGTASQNEVKTSIRFALESVIEEKSAQLELSKETKSLVSPILPDLSPLKIIIAGAPASGKGTQCEVITSKFGVVHLSTGDILRAAVKAGTAVGLKAKSFMDAGKLVPDEVIIDVVVERLKEDDCATRGWLLDGFPRTQSQADALIAAGMIPDCFILLNVPEEVLVERVTGRRTDPVTGKIYHMKFSPPENAEVAARLVQRSDDTAEKIVVRYKEFQSHIDEVESRFQKNFILVDGTASASEVSRVISLALNTVLEEKLNPPQNDDEDNNSHGGNVPVARSVSGSLQKAVGSSSSQTALGMLMLLTLDKHLRSLFLQQNIAFPSSLGGMMAVFALLCSASAIAPEFTDRQLFYRLSHAAALLKTWLPLFFVPPLVVLPLKASLLKGLEWQLGTVTAVGAAFSLLASGFVAQQLLPNTSTPSSTALTVPESAQAVALPPLRIPLTVSALCAAAVAWLPLSAASKAWLLLPFSVSSTMAGFVLGTKSSKSVRALLHPVLVSAVYTAGALLAFGALTQQPFAAMLGNYYGTGAGAGDRIATLLGPAIICFGLQLFQYRGMLFENAAAVLATTLSSTVLGLLSSASLSKWVKLAPQQVSLAPLTRCITSPLALAGAQLTGADPSLSALIVVLTGIVGASVGELLLNKANVVDPLAVGLSIGASAHGLGTAAVAYDPVKFAAAVVSMTLTGLWTVSMLSVTPLRNQLIKMSTF